MHDHGRADFEQPGFVFGESHPWKNVGYTYTSGWVEYGEVANRLIQTAYAYGWVRDFNWSSWLASEEGKKLWNDPRAISEANEDELASVITTDMRGEKWDDGHLNGAFEEGVLTAIVTRAGELLALAEDRFGQLDSASHRKHDRPRVGEREACWLSRCPRRSWYECLIGSASLGSLRKLSPSAIGHTSHQLQLAVGGDGSDRRAIPVILVGQRKATRSLCFRCARHVSFRTT